MPSSNDELYAILSGKFRKSVEEECEFMHTMIEIESITDPGVIKRAINGNARGWRYPEDPYT